MSATVLSASWSGHLLMYLSACTRTCTLDEKTVHIFLAAVADLGGVWRDGHLRVMHSQTQAPAWAAVCMGGSFEQLGAEQEGQIGRLLLRHGQGS